MAAAVLLTLPVAVQTLQPTGGEDEDRTHDLRIANAALSQLSYPPGSVRHGPCGPLHPCAPAASRGLCRRFDRVRPTCRILLCPVSRWLCRMNPDAKTLWTAPRWAFALLLALLGMLGPFSIDTYIPAFAGIGRALGATPVEMQQTLSSYLFGFAAMNLFHGALADSFGRRPVVLWSIAVFTLASAGCALSQGIGQLIFFRFVQGLSAGAGMVVSRAVIRDMYPPADAQ